MALRWLQVCIISCALLLILQASPCLAEDSKSKLDAFEKDVTQQTAPPPKPDADDEHKHHCHHADADEQNDSLSEALARAFAQGIGQVGQASLYRANPSLAREHDVTPRLAGEPLLPMLRLETSMRTVAPDITAVDLRAEIGYGPAAFHYSESRYQETSPKDALVVREYLGLYRMSFTEQFEIDLGYGQLTLDGNRFTTKSVFVTPVLYHDIRHWGLEFRPAWAENFADYDLAASYSPRFATLKVGYRWMLGPTTSLSGPYAGLAVQY